MTVLDATSTADDVLTGLDLSGKVAVVTGSSGGLGLETALALGRAGADLIVTARDEDSLGRTRAQVGAASTGEVDGQVVDLASLESVRRAASEVGERHPRIDLLINNAGIMAVPERMTSEDGLELQFATNYLGHFLWSLILSDALTSDARLVAVSSAAHHFATVDLADPNFERRPYDPWIAYGQSKTADIWFASEYGRRFGGRGVSTYSVHPGAILTGLQRSVTPEVRLALDAQVTRTTPITMKTIPQGAATTCWAATATEILSHSGAYLEDCRVAGPRTSDTEVSGYAEWAYHREGSHELWERSLEWTR